RQFVRATTAAGVAAAAMPATLIGGPVGPGQGPTVLTPKSVRPVVISSANGNRFKNGGTQTAVEKAFLMMTNSADLLDAPIARVNIVELDPLDESVGYGGLPHEDGVAQLDAWCMPRLLKRAAGRAALS